MRSLTVVGVVLGLLVVTSITYGRVWYVHPDSAIKTIQSGLDSCRDHDTVRVGPATYHERINWPMRRGIDLLSQAGAATTIIDGDSSGSVITINSTIADTLTVISGFTIRNGYSVSGCGIYLGGASPTITNNIICDNKSDDQIGQGIGVYCTRGAPKILNNTFRNNRGTGANGGGAAVGLYICTRAADITGNTITGNRHTYGGGINLLNCTAGNISRNNISFNTAGTGANGGGGAFFLQGSTGIRIADNTIRGNRAQGGTVGGGLYICYSSAASLLRNTIDCDTGFAGGGIHLCNTSTVTIDSCTISNCSQHGIYTHVAGMPVIHYSSIINNAGSAIQNDNLDTLTINAENNWWGDSTGAYHPTLNPGGRGDTVSDYVDFIPWLRWPVVRLEEENHARCMIHNARLKIHPNPFRNRVTIIFNSADQRTSASAGGVSGHQQSGLNIYDASGRPVKSFNVASHVPHPSSFVSWNGCDDRGTKLPAGVYLVRYVTDSHQETQKVVLVR